MAKPIKKQIVVELCDEELAFDVDMAMIESVESVYDANADVVAVMLQDPSRVKLTQLADIYLALLRPSVLNAHDLKRKEVREYIYTADNNQLNKLVGSLQAAVLYFRRHIDESEFEKLKKGISLDDAPEVDADSKKDGSEGDGQSSSTD